MKYIMFEDESGVFNSPVIFPEWIPHIEIARKMGMRVKSAGFVQLEGSPKVYGESVSLKVATADTDNHDIEMAIKLSIKRRERRNEQDCGTSVGVAS